MINLFHNLDYGSADNKDPNQSGLIESNFLKNSVAEI